MFVVLRFWLNVLQPYVNHIRIYTAEVCNLSLKFVERKRKSNGILLLLLLLTIKIVLLTTIKITIVTTTTTTIIIIIILVTKLFVTIQAATNPISNLIVLKSTFD